MKINKIFLMLALVALMPLSMNAQDARGRLKSTIIADNIQSLPAETPADFNKAMDEIAKTGAEGAEMLVANLAVKGDSRSKVEYAINGLVSYVSAPANAALKADVKKGMEAGFAKLTDNVDKAFVLTQIQFITDASDVEWLAGLLSDEYLAPHAMKALISTTGSESKILALAGEKKCPCIAYAIAEKGMTQGEPVLLSWLKSDLTPAQKSGVYYALGMIGSKASLSPLAAAAKATGYSYDMNPAEKKGPVTTSATYNYVKLLDRLVATGDKQTAEKAAKALLKATKNSNVRCAALDVIMQVEGKAGLAYVTLALKDADRAYRVEALRDTKPFADDDVYATVVKAMPKLSTEAQIDVINWLGTSHAASQIDAITGAFASSDNTTAVSAFKAASKIGGDKALTALIKELSGARSKEAQSALLSFNGNIADGLVSALDGDATAQTNALSLIGTRRVKAAAPKVFTLLSSDNAAVAKAAKAALSGVVTMNDFDILCSKLDAADNSEVALWQDALCSALHTETADAQSSAVATKMAASKTPARYYKVLAQASNEQAIDLLTKAFQNGADTKEAFAALLTINNDKMIDEMYTIASSNKDAAVASAALNRYMNLTASSKALNNTQKYLLLTDGLTLAKTDAEKDALIEAIAKTEQLAGLYVVTPYMDNESTARTAAYAVKYIIGKNKTEGGEYIKNSLTKALAIYKGIKNDPDAGYAVDEINKAINELPKGPEYKAMDFGTVVPFSTAAATTQLKKAAAKKAQADAAAAAKGWTINGNAAKYTASVESAVATAKQYGNFELYTEWCTTGDAAIGVRGIPEITLGGDNSGALAGNKVNKATANEAAAAPAGKWNSLYVKVVDDRVTVVLNGKTVTTNVILENTCDRSKPAPTEGALLLIAKNAPVELRNTYIKELPATPRFVLSPEEAKDGFQVLFDGTSLHNWEGNTTNYVPQNGAIFVTAKYGGEGNLYTKKEYSNFVLRFEFAFVTPGVNNGVGIRTPEGVDAAYNGMEIQVLDHDAPGYAGWLQKYQVHGSVYGIIPAKRVVFPELGTWNTEEIVADGDHIKVTVNGEVIVDGNIREACQGHNVAPDGSDRNEYTVDHHNHPGLFNKSGHIGFLGHGSGVQFRNVRIKELK